MAKGKTGVIIKDGGVFIKMDLIPDLFKRFEPDIFIDKDIIALTVKIAEQLFKEEFIEKEKELENE